MRFLTVVVLVGLVAGGGWAYYFGPAYVDEFKMQDVVGTAALTWQAFSEDRARVELKDQLRLRSVSENVVVEDCTFYEDAGEVKVVDCEWYVDVYPPMTEPRRLKFRVAKAAEPGATRAESR